MKFSNHEWILFFEYKSTTLSCFGELKLKKLLILFVFKFHLHFSYLQIKHIVSFLHCASAHRNSCVLIMYVHMYEIIFNNFISQQKIVKICVYVNFISTKIQLTLQSKLNNKLKFYPNKVLLLFKQFKQVFTITFVF